MTLLYSLLLMHMAADFLQPASLVKLSKSGIPGLIIHTAVYTAFTAACLYGYAYWYLWLLILASSHFLFDHLKFLASRRGVRAGPVYLFILDQALHVSIIALVALALSRTGLTATPWSSLMAGRETWILILGGMIAGTTGVSIFIFELDRTFFSARPDLSAVIDIKARIVGILERGSAMILIFAGVPYLAPLAFAYSVYGLSEKNDGRERVKRITDVCVSMGFAFLIAFTVIILNRKV